MTTNRKTNRRPQASKGGENKAYMRGMQELRRSNASGFHKTEKSYNRNDKSWKKDF